MPTAIDENGIVHDLQTNVGLAIPRCGMMALSMSNIRTHEEQPVTCYVCMGGEAVLKNKLFIICDGCGRWWQEQNETLVEVQNQMEASAGPPGGDVEVMKPGTLPRCKVCK